MKHSEEEKKTHPLSTITPAMNSMIIHYKALFFIARAHAYKDLPSR